MLLRVFFSNHQYQKTRKLEKTAKFKSIKIVGSFQVSIKQSICDEVSISIKCNILQLIIFF